MPWGLGGGVVKHAVPYKWSVRDIAALTAEQVSSSVTTPLELTFPQDGPQHLLSDEACDDPVVVVR